MFISVDVNSVAYIFTPMIVESMLTHVVCNASSCVDAWPVIKMVKVKHRALTCRSTQYLACREFCAGLQYLFAYSAAFASSRRPPAYVLAHLSASCSAVELQGVTMACRTLESCMFELLTAILSGVS